MFFRTFEPITLFLRNNLEREEGIRAKSAKSRETINLIPLRLAQLINKP